MEIYTMRATIPMSLEPNDVHIMGLRLWNPPRLKSSRLSCYRFDVSSIRFVVNGRAYLSKGILIIRMQFYTRMLRNLQIYKFIYLHCVRSFDYVTCKTLNATQKWKLGIDQIDEAEVSKERLKYTYICVLLCSKELIIHLLHRTITFRCILRCSSDCATAHNRQLEKRKTLRQFVDLTAHRANCKRRDVGNKDVII